MTARNTTRAHQFRSAEGSTLIETMFACAILLVAMTGLMGMSSIATALTENEGHLSARTTEYAVDKMEQLQALKYGDAQSNTTLFPAATSGGTGLAVGGGVNPAAPADGYVDYLDQSGNLLVAVDNVAPANWFYKRVWQIAVPSANLKQITVVTIVKHSVAGMRLPQSTVSALKTSPF